MAASTAKALKSVSFDEFQVVSAAQALKSVSFDEFQVVSAGSPARVVLWSSRKTIMYSD